MKKKVRIRLWYGAALAFTLLALALTAFSGDHALLLFAKGSAEETVDSFFAHLEKGEYAAASALCTPALPAESVPEAEDAALLYNALCASRQWQRSGEAVCRGNRAEVSGSLTVLDPALLCEGMNADVNEILAAMVAAARVSSEIYNQDGSYREEVVMEAWNRSLAQRLEKAGDYTSVYPLTLQLIYDHGSWRLQPDEALMRSLSGGVA